MLYQAPINSRNQFSSLLNSLNLLGIAVEVGTHRGKFASQFLNVWNGHLLYCIDPWELASDYENQIKLLETSISRQEDYAYCKKLLSLYKDRLMIYKMTSLEAVDKFNDNEVDFVYIDGNHEPPYVLQDIQLWWPKIKQGGILAGHDFLCPGEVDGGWGQHIQPTVLDFFMSHTIYLVIEADGSPWSYYVRK